MRRTTIIVRYRKETVPMTRISRSRAPEGRATGRTPSTAVVIPAPVTSAATGLSLRNANDQDGEGEVAPEATTGAKAGTSETTLRKRRRSSRCSAVTVFEPAGRLK